MKTILYATDYSDNSIAALSYAHALSTHMNAKLVVLHVFDIPTVLSTAVREPYQHLEEETFKMHRTKLDNFCREHLGDAADQKHVQLVAVEHKSVVDGIVSQVKEFNAYLVVTGMKGGSVLKELLMGSTTKHLIDTSPCPVLAIPMTTSHRPIKSIVYTTDFEEEDLDAIYKLVEMARIFNAFIHIVHFAEEKNKEAETKMSELSEKVSTMVAYKQLTFEVVPSDDVFSALKVYLTKMDADVVAMMERKNKGLYNLLFHRDLVKKMETYGQIPLLSFNKINRELFTL